jgi:hypothetical protein
MKPGRSIRGEPLQAPESFTGGWPTTVCSAAYTAFGGPWLEIETPSRTGGDTTSPWGLSFNGSCGRGIMDNGRGSSKPIPFSSWEAAGLFFI